MIIGFDSKTRQPFTPVNLDVSKVYRKETKGIVKVNILEFFYSILFSISSILEEQQHRAEQSETQQLFSTMNCYSAVVFSNSEDRFHHKQKYCTVEIKITNVHFVPLEMGMLPKISEVF